MELGGEQSGRRGWKTRRSLLPSPRENARRPAGSCTACLSAGWRWKGGVACGVWHVCLRASLLFNSERSRRPEPREGGRCSCFFWPCSSHKTVIYGPTEFSVYPLFSLVCYRHEAVLPSGSYRLLPASHPGSWQLQVEWQPSSRCGRVHTRPPDRRGLPDPDTGPWPGADEPAAANEGEVWTAGGAAGLG